MTFLLEGADSPKLRGWRNYLMIADGKRASVMSQPIDAEFAARKYGAKFFARGTWEDETIPALPDSFHTPRTEIVAEIYGTKPQPKQMELA